MRQISIFWFRRDLRIKDNKALSRALDGKYPVLPLFIFDKQILNNLESSTDRRVGFIHDTIRALKKEFEEQGASLLTLYGNPIDLFYFLIKRYNIRQLYFNHDYEPYATQRDLEIKSLCAQHGIEVISHKDQVIFEKDDIVKKDGKPYTVFTPYMKRWKENLDRKYYEHEPSEQKLNNLHANQPFAMVSLEEMGFKPTTYKIPPAKFNDTIIRNYTQNRDFPAAEGTSRLGIHFRHGTLSIRQAMQKALQLNETWLNELIWREFYMMILWYFPKVVNHAFKAKYDQIEWRNNEKEFQLWCEGSTGYPIVDAGMRELNQTGYMHNRVRMITASFLTKHLLIDWRWGEAYFAQKLMDYELASNNGGWQWAAGSGCDAAPYFRIFNPELQIKKFDPEHTYIKKWVPEYQSKDYVKPVVDHKYARERALTTYKQGLNNA